MKKPTSISKRELADHWQLSERAVERYVASGMPHSGQRRTLRFNVQQVEDWRARHVAPRIAPPWQDKRTASARRICIQCQDHAGYTFEEAETLESPDPSRFCWPQCAADFAAGKSTAQTRREFANSMVASGWTRRELKLDGYLDWLEKGG
jgi:hypothetical protein